MLDKTVESEVAQLVCGKRFLAMLTVDGKVWVFGNNEQNVYNRA